MNITQTVTWQTVFARIHGQHILCTFPQLLWKLPKFRANATWESRLVPPFCRAQLRAQLCLIVPLVKPASVISGIPLRAFQKFPHQKTQNTPHARKVASV